MIHGIRCMKGYCACIGTLYFIMYIIILSLVIVDHPLIKRILKKYDEKNGKYFTQKYIHSETLFAIISCWHDVKCKICDRVKFQNTSYIIWFCHFGKLYILFIFFKCCNKYLKTIHYFNQFNFYFY